MEEHKKDMDAWRERRRKEILERRRRQLRREKIALLTGTGMIVCLVAAALIRGGTIEEKEEESKEVSLSFEVVEEPSRVSIAAVGDNLFHSPLVETGQQENGVWNYESIYEHVKDTIQAADLAVVNQETIFVEDHDNVSGYPAFGTPTEVGDALVEVGFDVVQHASNHTYDKQEEGIRQSLAFWETKHPEITVLGIHGSQVDRDEIAVVEKNGIRIAMLNYTYGLNGAAPSQEKSYLIDIWDEERVRSDIQKAKAVSDTIVCFLHAGEEYSAQPNEDMQKKVQFLLEQGVKVTIGAHPHVTQKYEVVKDAAGNEMLVYYSLGNFVSTQQRPEALLGGIAQFTLEKSPVDGSVTFADDYSLRPIVMQYDSDVKARAVYYLSDYTEEMAERHSVHKYTQEEFTLSRLQELAAEIESESRVIQ